jgi:hypothetical protein
MAARMAVRAGVMGSLGYFRFRMIWPERVRVYVTLAVDPRASAIAGPKLTFAML